MTRKKVQQTNKTPSLLTHLHYSGKFDSFGGISLFSTRFSSLCITPLTALLTTFWVTFPRIVQILALFVSRPLLRFGTS